MNVIFVLNECTYFLTKRPLTKSNVSLNIQGIKEIIFCFDFGLSGNDTFWANLSTKDMN